MFVVPWILERNNKLKPDGTSSQYPKIIAKKIKRTRRTRSIIPSRKLTLEEEYPEYRELRDEQFIWTSEIEPRYRNYQQHFPPDWQRRRALVYLRDKGKCKNCRKPTGRLACTPEQIWNFEHSAHLLFLAEVHHVKRWALGGKHDLDNLVLLCLHCHSKEHPKNVRLGGRSDAMGLGAGDINLHYLLKAPKPPDGMPF